MRLCVCVCFGGRVFKQNEQSHKKVQNQKRDNEPETTMAPNKRNNSLSSQFVALMKVSESERENGTTTTTILMRKVTFCCWLETLPPTEFWNV